MCAAATGWRETFDRSAVGSSSKASYATAERHWRAFVKSYDIHDLLHPTIKPHLPIDDVEDILALFVGFCLESETCKANIKTIIGYVNGVIQFHATFGIFLTHSTSRWERTVSGMHRYANLHHKAKPTTQRRPITPDNICKVSVHARESRDARWFPAACEFMFAAFLRKSETFARAPSRFDPKHDPTVGDLIFTVNGVTVRGQEASWDQLGATRRGRLGSRRPATRAPEHLVYRAKHTKRCGPASGHAKYDNVPIALIDDNSAAQLNGVSAMFQYCADRNDGPHPLTADSPLFVYDGTTKPVSGSVFNDRLRHFLAEAGEPTIGRSSHSMRHGAASHAIVCGLDPAVVRRLGRWVPDSPALDIYVHNSLADARKRAASTDFVAPTPIYIRAVVDSAHLSMAQPRPLAA